MKPWGSMEQSADSALFSQSLSNVAENCDNLNTTLQWEDTAGWTVTVSTMTHLFELEMLKSGQIQRMADTFGTECTLKCTLTHTGWTGAAGHNNTGLLSVSQDNDSPTPLSPSASLCLWVCVLGGYIKKPSLSHPPLCLPPHVLPPSIACVCVFTIQGLPPSHKRLKCCNTDKNTDAPCAVTSRQ